MDPYKILGVSPDDDDATIKRAYRNLSKQYHPDNNPGDRAAEEKFKQIQAAYDQIMNMKKNGYTAYREDTRADDFSSFFGFRGFGGFGQNANYNNYTSQAERDLQSAATYINNGHFQEALHVLNEMQDRNGTWYYLSSIANYNLRNNVVAMQHITKAMELEPNNPQYRNVYNRMSTGTMGMQNRYSDYDHSSGLCTSCIECVMCDISFNLCCGGGC